MKLAFDALRETVIDRGLCTACGTCVGVCPQSAISIKYEQYEPLPALSGKCVPCGLCVELCPGADVPMPELERFCFGRTREERPDDLGIYRRVAVAWPTDAVIREAGGGGGVVTAVLAHALESGYVDCCIVAGFDDDLPWRARPKLATTREELIAGAQSKHVVVTNNELLGLAIERGYQKIGVVGLPCQVHGLRKIGYHARPKAIAERIKLVISPFCGTNFLFEGTRHQLFEWCDIEDLSDVQKLEYRGHSWPGHFVVQSKTKGETVIDRHTSAYHGLAPCWGRDRCMMCIDYSGELADLSVGSYWAPGLEPGVEKGRTAVLIRTDIGQEIIESADRAGALQMETVPHSDLLQIMGFESKKHGHVTRLMWRQRFGWPVPNYHYRSVATPIKKGLWTCPEDK